MSQRTYVIGVGMTKFDKPGTKEGDYPDWAKEAGEKALADAGVSYDLIEEAYAGYCYGDSTAGQRAIYGLGLTGIPVVNVNNNCSTGSSALYLAAGVAAAAPPARGCPRRPRRLRARRRLGEDGAGLDRREVRRPHQPARPPLRGPARGA